MIGNVTPKLAPRSDSEFVKACEAAKIPATCRQYSKWKRKAGLAWKTAKGAA